MTRSDWLVVFVVACALVAGIVVANAWPRDGIDPNRSVAVFCVLAVAALTMIVLTVRRGRP